MYRFVHAAYCGMTTESMQTDDRSEARDKAARFLRYCRRKGLPVTTLDPGRKWEIEEPDHAMMVPDDCGVAWIDHQTFECRECGIDHETGEDAAQCCAELYAG